MVTSDLSGKSDQTASKVLDMNVTGQISNPYQEMRQKLAKDTKMDSMPAGEAIDQIFNENSEYLSMIDQIKVKAVASVTASPEETGKNNALAELKYLQADQNMIELKNGKGKGFKWRMLDDCQDEAVREREKERLIKVLNQLTVALKYVENPLSEVMVFAYLDKKDKDKVKENPLYKALELYRKIYYARAIAFYRLNEEQNFANDVEIAIGLYGPDEFRYFASKHLVLLLSKNASDELTKLKKLKSTNLLAVKREEAERKIREDAGAKLSRAEKALLQDAYWDHEYPQKTKLLVKMYQNHIRPYISSYRGESKKTLQDNLPPNKSTLPSPSNGKTQKTPSFSNAQQVHLTDLLSRGLVQLDLATGFTLKAAKPINGGDLVFQERMVAYKPDKGALCAHCYKETGFRITPCHVCTKTTFCSEPCANQAIASPSTSKPKCNCNKQSITLGKPQHLVYQILESDKSSILEVLEKNDGDWQKLYQDYIRGKFNCSNRLFSAIAVLAKARALNDDKLKLNTPHNRNLLVSAIQVTKLLYVKNQSKDKLLKEETKLVYRAMWFIAHSPQLLWKLSDRAGKDGKQYGSGIGTFGASLNYTCLPNLFRLLNPLTSRLEYYAREDIPSGAELTLFWNVYQVSPSFFEAYRRRDAIKRHYHEDCACKICTKLLSFNPYPQQQKLTKRTQDDIAFRPSSMGPKAPKTRKASLKNEMPF